MWNEMKVKWIIKEAKVWFMEAQKWTQQCLLRLQKNSWSETIPNKSYSENNKMTRLKEPNPRIVCSDSKCYAPNTQIT
jgi:hypothetical protein